MDNSFRDNNSIALTAQAGYGIQTTYGTLTPFMGLDFAGESDQYRTGIKLFNRKHGLNTSLTANLNNPQNRKQENTLLFDLSLPF